MGMAERRFSQLDVFTAVPLRGNPLAVVHDAAGIWIGGAVCPLISGTIKL